MLLTLDRAGGIGSAWVLCGLAALAFVALLARIVRYASIWSAMVRMIRLDNADLLLSTEINEACRLALAGAVSAYTHRVEEVRPGECVQGVHTAHGS